MAFTVTEKKTIEPVPEGVHIGVCYLVADLGHQSSEKYGEKRQVVIGFELPELRITVEKDGGSRDMPRAASRRFTVSLNEKAELRKALQAWRGRGFTPDELKGFDLKNVIGVAALVQIVHERKTDGNVIAKIASVLALPKGTARPRMENEAQFFSFDECQPGQPVTLPANLPDWIRGVIEESREWKAASEATPAAGTATTPAPGTAATDADDDPIPF